MAKLIPVISGITGATVIVGASAYYLSTQNTTETKTEKKFNEVFKDALIKLNADEETLLKTKLEKLRKETPKSNIVKLTVAKNTTSADNGDATGLAALKGACQEIYNSDFTDREANIFKDFQSYCARTNKDKVTAEQWAGTNATWTTRYEKIKNKTKTAVSASLISILKEVEADGERANKLQKWCETVADSIYEGEENLELKDAKVFCGKEN